MSRTPHFNLDYLMPEQAQKHVTLNDALRRLDGLVQLSVKNRTEHAPPAAPENGDRYLIAASATGAWSGQDGQLALYEDTAWHFFTPRPGWRLWDEAAAALLVFDGSRWQNWQGLSTAPSDMMQEETPAAPSSLSLVRQESELLDVTGTVHLTIPSHKIFLGVTARVVEEIKGAQGWRLGTQDDNARFGRGLAVAIDSDMRGPADPSVIYWQPTPILVSPENGNFTAGHVILAMFYIDLPVPPRPA